MIKETERTEVIKEKHRYCDICGASAKTWCCKCKKDLCNKCVEHEDYDSGDYRGDCYCKECWDLGTPYRQKIEELENEIDILYREWDNKCKIKS